jgi:GntR family transcriptional regulator
MKASNRSRTSPLKSAPGPLYRHVATLIKRQIESGEFVPGERLASIESIAQDLDVAIVTVRQALSLLESDGLIERRQGRGTFVSRTVKEKRWLKLESSWDDLVQMWGRSTPRPLKVFDRIGTPILSPDEGQAAPSYRYMRRVHLFENIPYTVVDIYLDRRLYALCPERFDRELAIVVLDSRPEVTIKSMRQELTIGTADIETASLLSIPVNSPVGIVRRVIRDQIDVAIYVGTAVYRADLVKFEREIRKPSISDPPSETIVS